MEPVNTQKHSGSGLDIHKQDIDFMKSAEFMTGINNAINSYRNNGDSGNATAIGLAFKIAFVHPELKTYATREKHAATGGSVQVADSLLAYIPDHIPKNYKNNPVIKQIEAFATGLTANILEGNDITEEGDSLDNFATERTTDQLAGLKKRLFDDTNTTIAAIEATSVNVDGGDFPTINMNSLFGYTTGDTTIPGSDFHFVKVSEREWEELELYEKWFYYALKMSDGALSAAKGKQKASTENIGKLVYHIGNELNALMANPAVQEVVNSLCRTILGPGLKQVGEVNQGADRGANFGQLLTLLAIYPRAREAILSRYGNDIPQETKDEASEAFAQSDANLQMHSGRTDINLTPLQLSGVNLGNVIADIHTDEAINLANRLTTGMQDSSILVTLRDNPDIDGLLDKKKARLVRNLSVFTEHPEYKDGMVQSPSEEDAIDLATVDPKNQASLDAKKAKQFSQMASMSTPYDISRKVATDVIPDIENRKTVYDFGKKYVELDPAEWDVTNAYAIPKVAIPLFVKTLQAPTDNSSASVDISFSAMVIASYIILAYTDPSAFGYSPEWGTQWDERVSGERAETYTGEELDDIDSLKGKIESYFAKLASAQSPADPINFRNEWVSNINNSQLWSQVAQTTASVLNRRYRRKTADSADYREQLDKLYDVINNAKSLVKRYVFAIKENSRNLSITQDLSVLSASPLSPVNHASTSGTLRMTGGGEGVVTEFGRNLLLSTTPKVTRASKTPEGERFDVTVKVANGRTCSASLVDSPSSDELDTWMPTGLVIGKDTDVKNQFYCAWVGLTFCSYMTSDGVPENTLKVPEETVDTSNAVMSETPVNQASSSIPTGSSLREFGTTMHSMSSGALTAAKEALGALNGGKVSVAQAAAVLKVLADTEIDARSYDGSSGMHPAIRRLNSVLSLDKFSDHSTANSENVTAAINELIALTLAKSNKTYNTRTRGSVTDYSNAINGVSDAIKFCGKPHNDTYENTAERIKVALDGLLEEADGVKVILWPFSVSYDKNPERMSFDVQKLNDPNFRRPANIPGVATLENIRANIDRYPAEQLYKDTMTALKGIRSTYGELQLRAIEPVTAAVRGVTPDSPEVVNRKNRLKARIAQISSPAFKKAFVGFLNAVCPILKSTPEMNTGSATLMDFVHTIGGLGKTSAGNYVSEQDVINAIETQDTIAAGAEKEIMANRDAKPSAADMNRLRGQGKSGMLTGKAAEPYIGVNYDDDISGNALSSSIDEDALAGFDASENRDFMEICEYKPMLGMIKCDPVGMKNGSGNLDVNSGLNPDEFARVVHALDSAYDEIVNHRSERYNTFADAKIQEFMKNRVAAYDNAIMAFYKFFDDARIPAKRNLISDIELVLNRFRTAATACQDESMKPELNDAYEKLTALYQRARSAENDGNMVNNANRVASMMSTGFADVILQLDASLDTAMVSVDAPNIRGTRDAGTMSNVNLALQTMHKPGTKDSITGKPLTRVQTDAFKKANAIAGKEIQNDLMGRNGEVNSLNTAYGHLGLDFTAGAMNSVSPFDDMIRKLGSKNANVYRKTYGGEAKTDLCTALLWAITEDESERGNNGYRHVEELLDCLHGIDTEGNQRPTQVPVNVRNFLLGGVRLDETGEDVDLDQSVSVTFTADGDAVPTETWEVQYAMRSNDEVIDAAGLPMPSFAQGDTGVDDMVREIRTSIIELHLADSRDILREVKTKAAIFGTERERSAIISEYSEMLKHEARTIKTDGENFIPLATLFSYSDLGSLNAAKWEKIRRAAKVLINTQEKSLYDRIMKDVFDDVEPEDMGERYDVESNRSAITGKIAEMFGQLKANPQADRNTVVNGTLSTPCEGTNGASLEDILGEDKAVGLVLDAYAKFTENRLANLDDRKLRIIADQIAGIHCQTTGDIMARLATELYELGTGAKTYEAVRSAIVDELGQGSEMPAEQLIDAFAGKLGWDSHDRPAGFHAPDVAIRNTANAVVNGESRKNGEFRNIVSSKNPSDALQRINARKEMKGTHPIVDQEQLDPNSGADAMFAKLYDTVLKADTLDSDELKELDSTMLNTLKTRFTASQVLNDTGSVWAAMAGIISNAVAGMNAKLRAHRISQNPNPSPRDAANLPKYEKKVHDRVCSADPFNTTPNREDRTLGLIRINGIRSLLDALHGVVSNVLGLDVSGKSTHAFVNSETGRIELPGTGSRLADFMNTFIARTTYWTEGTDLQTLEAKAAELSDPDTQKTLEDETKECIAYMYCWTPSRYQEASISALNAASMQRGMGDRSRTTRKNAAEILEFMADEYPSVVQRVDSDAVDTAYIINGHHLDEEQAEGVINDAYNMFADTHQDEIINDRYDGEFIVKSADFLDCVKRCANPVKDYPLHSEEITALVMRYLMKKRFVSKNSRGTILFKTMFKPRKGASRQWFTFILPFSAVTGAAAQIIGQTNVSNRGTDWNYFARELDNYVRQKTSKSEIERNNATLSESARNQLYKLVESVAKSIAGLCKAKVDGLDQLETADMLRATKDSPYELPDFIGVYPSIPAEVPDQANPAAGIGAEGNGGVLDALVDIHRSRNRTGDAADAVEAEPEAPEVPEVPEGNGEPAEDRGPDEE